MDVKIVEARPDHAGFLAWVTLTAFRSHLERGFWDILLGRSEEERLRFLEALVTSSEVHWVHQSITIVAEVEGRPVSALSGYFEEEHGGGRLAAGMDEAGQLLGWTDEERADGWQRAGSIISVVPEHVPGAWIVENVATLPGFRRKGLVDRLMEEILQRGRTRGATVSDISVFIGNDPAQRAYEKAGFEVIGEKRNPDFEAAYKTPGVRTLRRPLYDAGAK